MNSDNNTEITIPERILMGPGPSNVHPRVYKALNTNIVGHLDPIFLKIMDEIGELLRAIFKTQNRLTMPMSGTGSSGMEASFVNVIEPGDKAIICINGVFGERMADVASRCGANVVRVEKDWGKIVEPDSAIDVLKKHPDAKVFAIVQAETSTGAMQPLIEIGDYLKNTETLFLVDAVTSLSGCDLRVDEWSIDICFSGTQKCISVPPGISPITFSEKAEQILSKRSTKVQSWYLDLNMIRKYWGSERVYHHTAPISMLFALREGLKIILEEGLENRFLRHEEVGKYLKQKLLELGFSPFAQENHRLPMLTSVIIPGGYDDDLCRKRLLDEFNIEIGVGLGKTKGEIWRIGLMGETCTKDNVDKLISALNNIAN